MQHIQGIARNQLQVSSLENSIGQDNPVRFIDAFVNLIDLEKIGFTPRVLKTKCFSSSCFPKTRKELGFYKISLFRLKKLVCKHSKFYNFEL
ncbi:hypothetical protein [Flavobacterium sp.]|uniref:hypothetical protein n=1 Tax=Flavobacterium sp. TaxID=239 RepID=UPI0022CBEBBA|nr:hypothetical protein [Flavobacterium sp.]MCZ8091638.1 hypothetical protein [Flavobacterium sp.]